MEKSRDEDLFEPVKRKKNKKGKPKDAHRAELTAATTAGSSSSSSKVAEPKGRMTACLRCLEEGHFVRECRNPVRCRYCRGEGHSKTSCPSLVSQSRSGTSARARGGSFGSLPGGESAKKPASSATSGPGKVSGSGGDSAESQRRSEPADEQARSSAASTPDRRSRTVASKTGAHARVLEEGGDNASSTEKKNTDGGAAASTGIKRRRSVEGASGSGLTPAKKKWEASTSFTYASVSKGARSLVAHKEGTSVTSAERDELIDLFERAQHKAILEGGWFPSLERLRLTRLLGRYVLVVDVEDEETAKWFIDWAVGLEKGLSVVSFAEFKRRDLKVLSGLIQGVTGTRKVELLRLFLQASAKKKDVPGTVEIIRSYPTPTGLILEIGVEPEGLDRLAELDFTLSVGGAGNVKFQEVGRRTSTLKLEATKARLEQELAEVTRELEKDGEVAAGALDSMCVDGAGVVEEDVPETTVARLLEGLTSDSTQRMTVGSPRPAEAANKN